jgi:hypothetical protein
MDTSQLLQFLQSQRSAIQTLIDQLDEVQVAFNAEFDSFQARHDDALERLVDQVSGNLDAVSPDLRAIIDERLPEELERIEKRRAKLEADYLPQRRQVAAGLLQQAQSEVAMLRSLNPELDEREESLKSQKAQLEAELTKLNDDIREWSRGLGVVRHFLDITRADRERHKIIGQLETMNESIHAVRTEWDKRQGEIAQHQAELKERWQIESIAAARLQSELDQLDNDDQRADLALRRAIRHALDSITAPLPASDPGLDQGIAEMAQLNVETDAYHAGLASVGGFIGLARGVTSGLEAIARSIEGLQREQQMHSAHLKALSFKLPAGVDDFHKQWPALTQKFADDEEIRANPAAFSDAVTPILDGTLSEESIEAMFRSLGAMIQRATARW